MTKKKLSFEKAQARIIEIDAQMQALSEERNKISAAITASGRTKYHRGTPAKVGLYHYSSLATAPIGGAIGYWDGHRWIKYKDWGDFTNRGEVVWYGDGRSRKEPLQESSI